MPEGPLELELLPGGLAVCRLGPEDAVPAWSRSGAPLRVVARTDRELSIVCDAAGVPAGVTSQGPFRALRVRGPLDFSLVGILADLAGALADAGISLFAVSTYDTDYLLVAADRVEDAMAVLRRAGHRVSEP